jgi:hypothetical protein
LRWTLSDEPRRSSENARRVAFDGWRRVRRQFALILFKHLLEVREQLRKHLLVGLDDDFLRVAEDGWMDELDFDAVECSRASLISLDELDRLGKRRKLHQSSVVLAAPVRKEFSEDMTARSYSLSPRHLSRSMPSRAES